MTTLQTSQPSNNYSVKTILLKKSLTCPTLESHSSVSFFTNFLTSVLGITSAWEIALKSYFEESFSVS